MRQPNENNGETTAKYRKATDESTHPRLLQHHSSRAKKPLISSDERLEEEYSQVTVLYWSILFMGRSCTKAHQPQGLVALQVYTSFSFVSSKWATDEVFPIKFHIRQRISVDI